MNNQIEPNDKDKLEQLIDRYGVHEILVAMSVIAYEKAEHMATNWQDRNGEKLWNKIAKKLDTCATLPGIRIV